jgi:hypothetical protein
MKRSIIALTIAASMLAVPSVKAYDHWDDLRSDVHSLWEWYGHLNDEASAHHHDHHVREELDGVRSHLKRIEAEIHDGHEGERVRGEVDGVREDLRHINGELNWHGEVQHRPGFTIEFH